MTKSQQDSKKIKNFYNLLTEKFTVKDNSPEDKIVKDLKFKLSKSNKRNSIDINYFLKQIKNQPWQNYEQGGLKIYQCYCNKLKKFLVEPEDEIKLSRTSSSDGKVLRYQKYIDLQFNKKNIFRGQFCSIKTFKLVDNSLNGQFLKTFQLKNQAPLSLTSRSVLNSFKNKYIYYAIDDILYLLDSKPSERDNLLKVLYSSMVSLHNQFSVNFFDIWIDSIYFNESFEINRFLKYKSTILNPTSTLTLVLKLHYFTRTPIKRPEAIW